jgi:uncharacterized protein YqfA (UPF0365 family)
MIARGILRDLGALTLAGALTILTVAVAGPLAALAVLFIVVPALLWLAVLGDRACQRAGDERLQELEARRVVRVQRTVHAEPMARSRGTVA